MSNATLLDVLAYVAAEHGSVLTSLTPNEDGTWTFAIWSDGEDEFGDTFRCERTHECAESAMQAVVQDIIL